MKHLKVLPLLFLISMFIFNCNDEDFAPNSNSQNEPNQHDMITSYNCTLIVYQNANYTLKGEEASSPVSVVVGQLFGNWSSTGHNTGWTGFYTNPQTWQDDDGTYETTSFSISYNFNWVDGSCPGSTAIYEVGSGSPFPIIYFESISSCPSGSGNITTWDNPANSLSVNTAYSFRVSIETITDDEKVSKN
jgi:hypothetical protein